MNSTREVLGVVVALILAIVLFSFATSSHADNGDLIYTITRDRGNKVVQHRFYSGVCTSDAVKAFMGHYSIPEKYHARFKATEGVFGVTRGGVNEGTKLYQGCYMEFNSAEFGKGDARDMFFCLYEDGDSVVIPKSMIDNPIQAPVNPAPPNAQRL